MPPKRSPPKTVCAAPGDLEKTIHYLHLLSSKVDLPHFSTLLHQPELLVQLGNGTPAVRAAVGAGECAVVIICYHRRQLPEKVINADVPQD